MSRLSLGALLGQLRADSGPPLWYLIEKPVVRLAETFGLSDQFLRAPAWLAALGVTLLAPAGARGRGRAIAILLGASSLLFFLYSSEARAYALLAFLDLGLFLAAARGTEDPRRLSCVAVLAAASLYTHYLAIFFAAALWITLATLRRWRSLAAAAGGAVLFVPWVPLLLRQPLDAMSWVRESPGKALVGFAAALGGAGRIPSPFGPPLPEIVIWFGVLATAAGAGAVAHLQREDRDLRAAVMVTALTLGFVLLCSFVRPVAFAGRSELAVLGVWIWALARAAHTSRLAFSAAVAAIALGTIAILVAITARFDDPVWRPATAAVARIARPGDRVFGGAGFYLPLRIAADRGRLHAAVESFPADLALHPGWFAAAPAMPEDFAALRRRLGLMAPSSHALLLIHPYYATALERAIEGRGRIQEVVRRPDAVLLIWTPPARSESVRPPA